MRLERYNQIIIALAGTSFLVGGLAAAGGAAIGAFTRHSERGITVVDANSRSKMEGKESLVICPPIQVSGSDYDYFPIAAVVLSDANRTPVVSQNLVASVAYDRPYSSQFLSCGSDYHAASRIFNVVIRDSKQPWTFPCSRSPPRS